VGFWVHESIVQRVSETNPAKEHASVLWIKFVGDKTTMHMAAVYSRPEKTEEHRAILATLDSNVKELQQTGGLCIMGDFNSKLTHITEGKPTSYAKNSYMRILRGIS
jgi:hypothetical protein